MKAVALVPIALVATFMISGCAPDPRPDRPSNMGKRIHMQQLDRNDDNFLTRNELDANHRLAINFATWDIDNDGRISEAEFVAYVNANTD